MRISTHGTWFSADHPSIEYAAQNGSTPGFTGRVSARVCLFGKPRAGRRAIHARHHSRHIGDCQRAHLDRRSQHAVGRGARRQRRDHRGGRNDGGYPRARRRGTSDRRRRTVRRAGLHRHARALHRRRLPPGLGAAARREDARRVRQPHRGVRRDRARRHVDHRRRLGSHAVGRRAAARATGSTPRRRTIRCGSIVSTATWRSPTAPR